MIKIPANGQFIQTNRSDIFGSMVGSFNLDITTNFGKQRVTRTIQTASQNGNGTVISNSSLSNYPVGFRVFNDGGGAKIWTVAGSRVHKSGSAISPAASFAVDATSGTPTTCNSEASDIEVFNEALYVTTYSGGDKLFKYTGSWSENGTGLGSQSSPHMMTVYGARLYMIGNGPNVIYSMNTSDTIATSSTNTLTLPTGFRITFLRSGSNRIWIGTIASTGKGSVFEWDGTSTQATRSYRLEAQGAMACVIKDDIPYVVDTNGILLTYSGGTFVELARLPVNDVFLSLATNVLNNRPVHPNGMTVVNGRINILLNNLLGDSGGSIAEFCPSGIWEYDSEIGLYHKHSLSYTSFGGNTITDYGQNRLSGVGALSEMKLTNSASNSTGNLLAGAVVYTNASSTDAGIWTNDLFDPVTGSAGEKATQAFGYFVTTKISSSAVQDTWQKLYAFHEKFLTATDKIIVKYRTSKTKPVEASITWLNTTAFTTTTDVSDYVVGDEVEITQGTGGGLCAHIIAIQEGSGSTYIVTLDETFTGVTTGTAKARFQKWRKAGVIQDSSTFDKVNIGVDSDTIQLKIAMLSTGKNEIRELALINQVKQLAQ